MRGTTEVLPRSGFLGQRDLQTVEMPVEPTVGAWDNCTIRSRCSAMALMAEDGLSFAVLQAEIIWGLLVTRAIPSNVLVKSILPRSQRGAHFGFGGAPSSYSPSGPILTSAKYSRTCLGRRKAVGFFLSRLKRRGPKTPFSISGIRRRREVAQTLQNHSSGRASSFIGGSTQLKWKDRVQPSQHTRSPLAPHAQQ
jgi:hypothetical protein